MTFDAADPENPPVSAGRRPPSGQFAPAGGLTQPADRPDATFWSEADEVYVTTHHGPSVDDVWGRYVDGLRACYERLGVGHLADDRLVRRDACAALWLAYDRDWQVVGGIRYRHPIWSADDVHRLAALDELATSPTLDRFEARMREVSTEGLVEIKGAWSAPGVRRLGNVLGCCGWFANWWFGTGHGLGTGSGTPLDRWLETGAVRLDGFTPAGGFPTTSHQTEPVLWSVENENLLQGRHRRLVTSMRAQLHPARAREIEGQDTIETVFRPERIERLRLEGVTLIDQVDGLRGEAEALKTDVAVGTGSGHPWIHYPWHRTAVRILGPDPYRSIRSDRNRYKLTTDEMDLLRQRSIGVIGLSIGAAVAFCLAQEGLCGQLRLADFDDLELSNMNRLAGSILDLGTPKTELARRRILELDPYLELRIWSDGVDADSIGEFMSGLDLVIEECDSLDVKVLVREHAIRLGLPVVMETSDRGLLDVERFDREPGRPPFHGLVGDLEPSSLVGLSNDDKVPYVLDILDAEEMSPVLAASMIEIGETLSSWPQLASDVALGAALACHAARTILLDKQTPRSGRVRVDLDQIHQQLAEPVDHRPDVAPPLVERKPLPADFESAIVAAASQAPSGGNAQPWAFHLGEGRFEVHQRPDGVGLDVAARGTAVACGAALFNARCVAAVHHMLGDVAGSVDMTLDLDRPDLIAALPFGSATNPDLAALADQIHQRVSNRRLDRDGRPLAPSDVDRLAEAAAAEGGRLIHAPRDRLGEMAEIWAESDRFRYLTQRLHTEMFDEVCRPGLDPLDRGLDERTLDLSPTDLSKLAVVRRGDVMRRLDCWSAGRALRTDAIDRFEMSAGLLVVSVDGDSRADYLVGGMALQRLWLTATALGLQLQPVSPVFGYVRASEELAEMFDPERAAQCDELRSRAWELLGIADDEAFVLALRAHRGPPPSAISERLAVDRVSLPIADASQRT